MRQEGKWGEEVNGEVSGRWKGGEEAGEQVGGGEEQPLAASPSLSGSITCHRSDVSEHQKHAAPQLRGLY